MADVAITEYLNEAPAATQPDYLAQMSYGLNGDAWGPNELSAGTPDSLQATHFIWDQIADDGVDSGWCSVNMVFQQGTNGLQFRVNEEVLPVSSVSAAAGIGHISILTTVQTQAALLWSNVNVMFFKNDVLVDQASIGSLGVDLLDGSDVMSQQVVHITPTVTDCDEVVLTGCVKLLAPEGTYPTEDGMFSQIMIYAA